MIWDSLHCDRLTDCLTEVETLIDLDEREDERREDGRNGNVLSKVPPRERERETHVLKEKLRLMLL